MRQKVFLISLKTQLDLKTRGWLKQNKAALSVGARGSGWQTPIYSRGAEEKILHFFSLYG